MRVSVTFVETIILLKDNYSKAIEKRVNLNAEHPSGASRSTIA